MLVVPVEGWDRVPGRRGDFLVGPENSWIESGSEVERLVFFSEAAGYSASLLFFIRPFTAFYAKRGPG
jgi:hypothetical protein